jgi:hypothetical protein
MPAKRPRLPHLAAKIREHVVKLWSLEIYVEVPPQPMTDTMPKWTWVVPPGAVLAIYSSGKPGIYLSGKPTTLQGAGPFQGQTTLAEDPSSDVETAGYGALW